MFGLFKSNPRKKLEKEYDRKLLEARDAQRAGKIQEYAILNDEAMAIYAKIQELDKASGNA